jgi:hypothetical protein
MRQIRITRPARRITLALLLATILPGAVHADPVLNCRPAVQYDCTQERCVKTTEGFQHAEHFVFDPSNGQLQACLWTRCYAGRAQIHKSDQGETTAIGSLKPETDIPDEFPLLASLTFDQSGRFVAIWRYAGTGLTFDQGQCTTE